MFAQKLLAIYFLNLMQVYFHVVLLFEIGINSMQGLTATTRFHNPRKKKKKHLQNHIPFWGV